MIENQTVETLSNYNYLQYLSIWTTTILCAFVHAVYKKVHQRIHFNQKLCRFIIDRTFMKMFYSCVTESILGFSFICWFDFLLHKKKKKTECRGLSCVQFSVKLKSSQRLALSFRIRTSCCCMNSSCFQQGIDTFCQKQKFIETLLSLLLLLY